MFPEDELVHSEQLGFLSPPSGRLELKSRWVLTLMIQLTHVSLSEAESSFFPFLLLLLPALPPAGHSDLHPPPSNTPHSTLLHMDV